MARAWRRAIGFHTAHPVTTAMVVASALSCLVYWSLLTHVRSVTPADPDSALFVWSMQHVPHRLLHGQNPFYSSAIFSTSGGANLAFSATAPLLGVLMAPITFLLGPVAAFNVLTALTPVLNTLAARRLLRVVSGVSGACTTLGALLVGFSPMIMMHNGARQQLVFQALSLLLMCELWILGRDYVAARSISRGHMVRAAALAGAQLWIGSEQLAIVAIIAVVVVVIAFAFALKRGSGAPGLISLTRRDLLTMVAAVGTMLAVGAPFLAAFFFGNERYTAGYHVSARPLFGLRLANLVTPTEATLLHTHLPLSVDRVTMSVFRDEDTGYIGLLAIAALLLIVLTWRRRTATQRGAVLVCAICWLFALGPTVRWSGAGSGPPGPWRLVARLPVMQEIVANRLTMAIFISLGVLVATVGQTSGGELSLAQHRQERSLRVVTPLLVLLLIPAAARVPRMVAAAGDRILEASCRGALVVTMPQSLEQEAMAWQARTDFAFNLYRGFAFRASTLPKGDRLLIDGIAETGILGNGAGADALDELRLHHIGCVVTLAASVATIDNLIPVLGTPIIAGDVAVWPRG